MTDITKCKGEGYLLKETCYRYKAPTGMRQSFFVEVPYRIWEEDCEAYWEIRTKEKFDEFQS